MPAKEEEEEEEEDEDEEEDEEDEGEERGGEIDEEEGEEGEDIGVQPQPAFGYWRAASTALNPPCITWRGGQRGRKTGW